MLYNLQNASFMHISSPINAIEDIYVTLGHFVKIKMASKMADSRLIMEMPYFSRFALFIYLFIFYIFFFFFFAFFRKSIVDVSTHLSLFNILFRKGDVKDGYQNTLVTNLAITIFYNLQNASCMHIWGILFKSRRHPQDGRFKLHYGNAVFFHSCIMFRILEGSDLHLSEKWLI